MKKKEIVIGVSVLISASLPISVYAASNESMSSRGFDIVNIGLHFILKNVRPYAAPCSEA